MRVPLVLLACATLATTSCGRGEPVANAPRAMNLPLPASDRSTDPAGLAPQVQTAEPSAAAGQALLPAIPANLEGRWGLTPADCTSTRGDAKGLLVVTGGALRFYESKAVPSMDVRVDKGTVHGDFHFTGEGETWTRYEALNRRGDKLTRTETNPAASYTYAKC